jgi:hypothetical protein
MSIERAIEIVWRIKDSLSQDDHAGRHVADRIANALAEMRDAERAERDEARELLEKCKTLLQPWKRYAVLCAAIDAYLAAHPARQGGSEQSGADMIAAERARQMAQEGWTPEHDDQHGNYELSAAACCYAGMGKEGPYSHPDSPPQAWPFERAWWKPSGDPVRNLVRAGALIAAEIDRVMRKREAVAIAFDAQMRKGRSEKHNG